MDPKKCSRAPGSHTGSRYSNLRCLELRSPVAGYIDQNFLLDR